MLLWFCQLHWVSLALATPAPAVGLIKTISRTKEGSLLYHTTSSATDTVPEGHSCQGLAPHRRRRWIHQPPTASDECLRRTTVFKWAVGMQMESKDLTWNYEAGRRGQFLIYLLLWDFFKHTKPVFLRPKEVCDYLSQSEIKLKWWFVYSLTEKSSHMQRIWWLIYEKTLPTPNTFFFFFTFLSHAESPPPFLKTQRSAGDKSSNQLPLLPFNSITAQWGGICLPWLTSSLP